MAVFGIMHTIKLKANNTMGVQLENNRTEKDCGRTFPGSEIEWGKTNENLHWVHSGNWDKSVYELCQKYDVSKIKKDSVTCLQTVYTASREWFTQDENGGLVFDEKAEQYFRDCMAFHVANYCGGREDLLINAVVHLDEVHKDGTGSIHFHCTSVPITENEKGEFVLSAKRVLGGRREMVKSQTKFYDNVCKARGMERGMSSNETKRQHLDNMSYKIQQEEKKVLELTAAREKAEKSTRTQEQDLEIAKAKTASEAQKTAAVLEHRMDSVASKNLFGKKKSVEYPGGTYYEVSKSDYERLQHHVSSLASELKKMESIDFASKEAEQKLKDLLAKEEEYIMGIARQMANERFSEMTQRENESFAKEKAAEQKMAEAIEYKNNLSQEAQNIAFEAMSTVPNGSLDEFNFVMDYLEKNQPHAFQALQQAMNLRTEQINKEIQERTERHHRHRMR